jgi:hypothetical protein
LNLLLVAALLPPFGLEGAAAATVVAVLFQAALIGRAAHETAVVDWRWRADFVSYGIAAACAGLALALPDTGWGIAVRAIAIGLAGLGFMRMLAAELRLVRPGTPPPAPAERVDPPLDDRSGLELG